MESKKLDYLLNYQIELAIFIYNEYMYTYNL